MASNAELEILSESSSCHSCPSSLESDTQSQLTLSILDKLKPPFDYVEASVMLQYNKH